MQKRRKKHKETFMEQLIPVVVIKQIGDTERYMQALLHSGVNCAEITFRTDCAEQAIELAARQFPQMEIGAGTVINGDQARRALAAGAKFIVSPGLSEEVAFICAQKNIPYYPGCVTPTEIMKAISLGIHTVKFFPANVYGGLAAMKALSAPFPQIKFIPTGGVNRENLNEFLSWEKVAAVGGSFIMEEALKSWQK